MVSGLGELEMRLIDCIEHTNTNILGTREEFCTSGQRGKNGNGQSTSASGVFFQRFFFFLIYSGRTSGRIPKCLPAELQTVELMDWLFVCCFFIFFLFTSLPTAVEMVTAPGASACSRQLSIMGRTLCEPSQKLSAIQCWPRHVKLMQFRRSTRVVFGPNLLASPPDTTSWSGRECTVHRCREHSNIILLLYLPMLDIYSKRGNA